mmetsp:Transcript_65685/g.104659  ORF Transcript_65685/g.104659 Transcript_65685/m.104659 type:complete len:104 (+) Transcript_65685:141-452(+)
MPHTIVLAKYNEKQSSQHWEDFDGVDLAMDGICQMYERQLKEQNPNKRQITYDIQNLFEYIDNLPDLSCLVFAPKYHVYEPKGKQWIKDQVFKHLKKQAAAAN